MGQGSSKISAQDKAILDLKNQRDALHRYQRRLTTITSRETEVARQCLAQNNKPAALLALRRKKYQETLLSRTDAQLEQLEQLTSSVEFALVQKDVLFGLQQGTSVLKEINREMGGVEGVERLMGDVEEQREAVREMGEALAGRMSNAEEDEVEEELDALEREVVGLPEAPGGTVLVEGELPDVPQRTVEGTEEERRQRQRERAKERRVALEAA
ncbi:uncharacterized protein HMPREF1541_03389 [Cyphellophora europaea CBS 101466]|uniref:Charged multivesicular body protein 6 n=1 Tax=Cyphellophora europaea (strain CBS 101466) TaxID=1220924 RepID=W2S0A3_CYPE1|nr:uncharacterized protein HMPREF1541_03389 [Cyphellophora europaea CBS 101466]ETN41453.1 hypothetical protein HMPREF1541_03389 [Cyphellophora europaea CBS 101466]